MVIPRETEKKSEVEKKLLSAFGIGFSFFLFSKEKAAEVQKNLSYTRILLQVVPGTSCVFLFKTIKPKQPTRDTSWITSLHLARRARAAVLDLRRNGFRLPRSRQVFA